MEPASPVVITSAANDEHADLSPVATVVQQADGAMDVSIPSQPESPSVADIILAPAIIQLPLNILLQHNQSLLFFRR